jgi:hypothetical protein
VQHREYARWFDGRERVVILISPTASVDGMATINRQRNGKGRGRRISDVLKDSVTSSCPWAASNSAALNSFLRNIYDVITVLF